MDKDKKDFVIGSIILGILLFMLCSVIVIVLYKKELDSSLNNAISDYIVSDYVYVEKVDLSRYNDIYTGDLQIPKINLNNLSSDVKDKFNTNMNDIISNIDEVSSSLRSKIEGEYTPNSSISINMDYSIYNDILSVKYVIYINRDFDLGMYIDNIYLNYDLNNNKELSNKELLDKDNIDINTISTSLFNYNILNDNNIIDKVIDSVSNEEITLDYIKENKEEYIKRISDNFDNKVNIYYGVNKIEIGYFPDEIINICYKQELLNNEYLYMEF